MAHGPGPNDFNFESGTQMPGLGSDEPSEKERADSAAAGEAERARAEALDRAAQEIEAEQIALEARTADLEAREAALAARLAELDAAGKRRGS